MELDVLVFAAHPDDAELAMGGTIAGLSANNANVGIVDLSEGEMSTRGTVETRKKEAQIASQHLNLSVRINLHMPDGRLTASEEHIDKVIAQIRKYKPKIIFAPYFNDRHPDHIGTSNIIKNAFFFSGLPRRETHYQDKPQEAYRPQKIFYYMQTYRFEPSFIVDISDYFETKMEAVKAYGSQFYNPDSEEPNTFISDPKFLGYLEARSKFYGFQIGKEYGEAFYSEEAVELNLMELLK
jgi:bacillithiol biosynthesis deacetylase BshB1